MSDLAAPDFSAHARRRAWFVALQAVLALCGITIALAVHDATTYSRTSHFVLHPNSSVPPAQVPQAVDVLDGSLVQTVLRVLNSNELLARTEPATRAADGSGVSIDATVQPGSAYFDATVRGGDDAEVGAVSRSYARAASQYVGRTYAGYDLELLGTSATSTRSFPPSPGAALLTLLLGALLGLGLVFLEWAARRPRLAAATGAQPSSVDEATPLKVAAVVTDLEPTRTATRARAPRPKPDSDTAGAAPKRGAARAPRATKSRAKSAPAPNAVDESSAGRGSRKPRTTPSRVQPSTPEATTPVAAASEETITELPSVDLPNVEALDVSISTDEGAHSNGHKNGKTASEPDGPPDESVELPAP